MRAFCFLWLCSVAGVPVLAQATINQPGSANVTRRSHPEYDEEIMYYGKRNQYFNVKVFRKNGALFRLDSYLVLPKVLSNGFELDSLSRISRFGPTKIMYATGRVYLSCEYKEDKLHGPFMVFYPDGAIKRRDYYKLGYLKRSQCFTPDGVEQTCTPFYRPAQFAGEPSDLSDYLKGKLNPVLDGVHILSIRAALSINEIGQIVDIATTVVTAPDAKQQVPSIAAYVKQIIRDMPPLTPDKLNWKPAESDGVATTSTCFIAVFRVYGSLRVNLSFGM